MIQWSSLLVFVILTLFSQYFNKKHLCFFAIDVQYTETANLLKQSEHVTAPVIHQRATSGSEFLYTDYELD